MNFITYPVNTKNPGSIIPIILGIQWGCRSPNNTFTVFTDRPSRKRNQVFDLEGWLDINELHFPDILQESKLLFSSFPKKFKSQINIRIHEGSWYRCPCGKVEFLDEAILSESYRKHLKLIDQHNQCVLCSGEVVLSQGRGLVVTLPEPDPRFIGLADIKEKVFPASVYQEVQYWINFFAGRQILLSRKRETPYRLIYGQEEFYIDPTLFDILSTFISGNTTDACIVTGRDAIIAYALGSLFFDKSPGHIFLPRFEIDDWNEIISQGIDELTILLVGTLNWHVNKVRPNLSDLKFIKKHKPALKEKLNQMVVSTIGDASQFSRSLYML